MRDGATRRGLSALRADLVELGAFEHAGGTRRPVLLHAAEKGQGFWRREISSLVWSAVPQKGQKRTAWSKKPGPRSVMT